MAADVRLRPGMALVFDMDGVIVDSNPWHTRAWIAYNRRCGIEVGDSWAERMYGRRNDEIVADFFGPNLSPGEIARHGAAKEQLYREMLAPTLSSAFVPGAAEFICRYSPAPMALATNAEPANVDFILDGAGIRRFFRVIIDGHQVRHAKPHPEIYLRAAELLGVPAPDCIVFEDSFSGIAAAQAAGTRVVGVRTTHAGLPGAQLEIDDFRDPRLEAWIADQQKHGS